MNGHPVHQQFAKYLFPPKGVGYIVEMKSKNLRNLVTPLLLSYLRFRRVGRSVGLLEAADGEGEGEQGGDDRADLEESYKE